MKATFGCIFGAIGVKPPYAYDQLRFFLLQTHDQNLRFADCVWPYDVAIRFILPSAWPHRKNIWTDGWLYASYDQYCGNHFDCSEPNMLWARVTPSYRKGEKYIQKLLGSFLYYARAIDMAVLHALSAIASEQSTPTKRTLARVH